MSKKVKAGQAAMRALRQALGACVRTDDESLYNASMDGMKLSFPCEAVVRVRRAEQVGEVLRLANRHRVPVTVRGAGSSLTGSAAPFAGGWVLDLTRLNRIRIDAEAGMASVGAGAIVGKIQEAAAEAGWFYPPDPSSKQHCTIGGNIACNAGGLHGAKYGVTRDYVIALEGYLPTGEFVRWGRALRKFTAGYNLRDLWIGSEGTLGVVTVATLRLLPLQPERWTLVAAYADEAAALGAVRRLLAARVVPAILEFIDSLSVRCAEEATGKTLFEEARGRPLLLVEVDGMPDSVARERAAIEAWAREGAVAWKSTMDRGEAEALWSVRRKCSPAMFRMGDSKLNEDIVVPLARQVEFMRRLGALSRKHGLPMPTFGHAADGNFHVNIMYHRGDAAEARRARAAVQGLMELVVKLGGAITGEHGIGLAKSPFMSLSASPAELRAMRAIKEALDPNGVLNPGKIFTRYEVWNKPREQVKFAWDHR
jgi:glycolate oxidase